jgi:hypothetical protein
MRASYRARRGMENRYVAPRRDDAEVPGHARIASVPHARMEKVEAARLKIEAAGYDIDANFKAAMRILIASEL